MINSFLIGPLFSIYFMIPTCLLLILLPAYILFKEFFRKKEDALPMVAHELRSSLTVIQGFAEILLSEALSAEQKKKILTKIHQSALSMSAALDSLLLLEKHGKLFLETCSIGSFLDRLNLEFRRKHPTKVLFIRNDLSLKEIKVHKELFYLAIDNLLDNAAKHGKSPILLKLTQNNKKIIFSVQNEGDTIAFKDLSQLFKKGFCKGETKGHGIGLYIVKKIVQKHKGTISVDSDETSGSIFTISLKV